VLTDPVTSDQGCETLTILGTTGTYTALYQLDTTATGTGKLKITT
jgi:hypothetical protein